MDSNFLTKIAIQVFFFSYYAYTWNGNGQQL